MKCLLILESLTFTDGYQPGRDGLIYTAALKTRLMVDRPDGEGYYTWARASYGFGKTKNAAFEKIIKWVKSGYLPSVTTYRDHSFFYEDFTIYQCIVKQEIPDNFRNQLLDVSDDLIKIEEKRVMETFQLK